MLVAVGCCAHAARPVDFLPVRQAQLRSPACLAVESCPPEKETYRLPLDAASRSALLLFFAAGGNNDNVEDGALTTVVDPDAEGRYGALLDALQNSANLDVADLTNGTYAAWFRGEPLRQVVDSRADRPPLPCPPYALRSTRYEWIFSCGPAGRLSGLLVQVAPGERLEK